MQYCLKLRGLKKMKLILALMLILSMLTACSSNEAEENNNSDITMRSTDHASLDVEIHNDAVIELSVEIQGDTVIETIQNSSDFDALIAATEIPISTTDQLEIELENLGISNLDDLEELTTNDLNVLENNDLNIHIGDLVFEYFDGQNWQLIQEVAPKQGRFLGADSVPPMEEEGMRRSHALSNFVMPREHTLLRFSRVISLLSIDDTVLNYILRVEFSLAD